MGWSSGRARATVCFSLLLAGTAACGGSSKPAVTGGAGAEGGSGNAEVGKPAPDLSIQALNGKGEISVKSLAGKVAIVDFWATWCAPCEQSFPKLEQLAKQNAGTVQVVGVACDDDKSPTIADKAKGWGGTFPIGWDEGHANAKRWKVEKMPTTFILDASGTVRFVHAGYNDSEADLMTREVALLASEPPPANAKPTEGVADKGSAGAPDKASSSSSSGDDGAAEPATNETAAPTKPKKGGGKPKAAGGKKAAPKKPSKKKT